MLVENFDPTSADQASRLPDHPEAFASAGSNPYEADPYERVFSKARQALTGRVALEGAEPLVHDDVPAEPVIGRRAMMEGGAPLFTAEDEATNAPRRLAPESAARVDVDEYLPRRAAKSPSPLGFLRAAKSRLGDLYSKAGMKYESIASKVMTGYAYSREYFTDETHGSRRQRWLGVVAVGLAAGTAMSLLQQQGYDVSAAVPVEVEKLPTPSVHTQTVDSTSVPSADVSPVPTPEPTEVPESTGDVSPDPGQESAGPEVTTPPAEPQEVKTHLKRGSNIWRLSEYLIEERGYGREYDSVNDLKNAILDLNNLSESEARLVTPEDTLRVPGLKRQ